MPHVLALAACLPLAGQFWTVDDDGGANFASVAEAIASPLVADGDVLLIEPGFYASATLTKSLTLLGSQAGAQPSVAALTVDGVARFDLQNLAFLSLDITAVPGRSRVDGCTVISGMKIEDAAELTVTRSLVEGTNLTLCGETALRITGASNVQLVDSTFRGGDGFDEFFEGLAGYGGAAVFVWDTSRVWIAGCDLTGGGGSDSNTPLWGFDPGEGGDALLAGKDARVDVRGSSFHVLAGGPQNYWDPSSPIDGHAISLGFGLTPAVEYSGVTTSGPVDPDAVLVSPPRPYLYVRGQTGPGETRRLYLYGPAGATALVATSFQDAFAELPLVQTAPVWLDLTSLVELFPAALAGPDVAFNVVWIQPANPSLAGLAYLVQAVLVEPSGALVGTNSSNLLLGF